MGPVCASLHNFVPLLRCFALNLQLTGTPWMRATVNSSSVAAREGNLTADTVEVSGEQSLRSSHGLSHNAAATNVACRSPVQLFWKAACDTVVLLWKSLSACASAVRAIAYCIILPELNTMGPITQQ